MKRVWHETKALFLPDGRDRALPRLDYAIIGVAVVVGALLVLADLYQRLLAPHPMNLLNIDGENNPETWFHSTVLVGAALCAFVIGLTYFDKARRWAWFGLGAGIGFFSLDKSASLHQRTGEKLRILFDLRDGSERLAWEIAWSPIIVAVAVVLIVCVWRTNRRTQLWAMGLLVGGAGKIALEAMTFVAVRYLGAEERQGWFYGIEVNIEESLQLLAFASLFAGFAQYAADRVFALARNELDAFDAAQVPIALPAWLAARLPSRPAPHIVAPKAVRPAE